ncbi:hypothetical protein JXO59_16410 [candidate division KSB1 bacterium]|nr:hypothetical protein [candidate division KSB1 bacterium]
MANFGYGIKAMALLLALMMLTTPMLVMAQGSDDFIQGKVDGERDAKGDPLWILAGVACSCIGVGAAYFTTPSPPSHALIGKSSEYVLGYTEGYKNKARNTNVMYACLGWLVSAAISIALGGLDQISE